MFGKVPTILYAILPFHYKFTGGYLIIHAMTPIKESHLA